MKRFREASVAVLAGCVIVGLFMIGCSQSQSSSPPPSAGTATTSTPPKPAPASGSPSTLANAAPGRWNFDADATGAVPSGAQVFSGQWAVRAEVDAPSPP